MFVNVLHRGTSFDLGMYDLCAACQIALEAEALVKPYGIHLLLLSCMQTEDWLIIRYNFSRKRKKTTHFISSRWHLYTLEVLR